jgi:hypothetical protein
LRGRNGARWAKGAGNSARDVRRIGIDGEIDPCDRNRADDSDGHGPVVAVPHRGRHRCRRRSRRGRTAWTGQRLPPTFERCVAGAPGGRLLRRRRIDFGKRRPWRHEELGHDRDMVSAAGPGRRREESSRENGEDRCHCESRQRCPQRGFHRNPQIWRLDRINRPNRICFEIVPADSRAGNSFRARLHAFPKPSLRVRIARPRAPDRNRIGVADPPAPPLS